MNEFQQNPPGEGYDISALRTPHSALDHSAFRLGVVAYLNMQPLVYGLEAAYPRATLEVWEGPPSRLARWLEEGHIDAGMVPVASLFAHPEWRVVSGGVISSHGVVRSVLAAGGGPPEGWRTLRPDSHSLTSNALTRVLLAGALGVRPERGEPLPLDVTAPTPTPPGEAAVLIGTRALAWRDELARRPGCHVADLGEWWTAWTGLPFVYAVWAARPGVAEEVLAQWAARLENQLEINTGRLERIAREWAAGGAEDAMSAGDALEYFTRNICYTRDAAARRGLELFYEKGRELGLFRDGWRWREAGVGGEVAED